MNKLDKILTAAVFALLCAFAGVFIGLTFYYVAWTDGAGAVLTGIPAAALVAGAVMFWRELREP